MGSITSGKNEFRKLIILIFITVFIGSCAKPVTYPIYAPCKKIQPPVMPELPIRKITAKSSDSEVIQALVQSNQIQAAYLEYFYAFN